MKNALAFSCDKRRKRGVCHGDLDAGDFVDVEVTVAALGHILSHCSKTFYVRNLQISVKAGVFVLGNSLQSRLMFVG